MIKTKNLNRFLESEYKRLKIEDVEFEPWKKDSKKSVNACPYCGIKYWNGFDKNCKCDLI